MSDAYEWPLLVDGRVASAEERALGLANATSSASASGSSPQASVPAATSASNASNVSSASNASNASSATNATNATTSGGTHTRAIDGAGVFETIRCEDGLGYELAAHLARLERGARAVGLAWPLARDVRADIERYVALVEGRDAALRVTVTRTASVVAGRALPEVPAAGRSLVLARVRVDPKDPSSHVKGTARARWDDALREARAAGADDALFLTLDGDVAETAVANVFARFGDELRTPPLERGVLAGIARAAVLDVAATEGLRVSEQRLTLASLASADEVLVTNALVRAVGVARIATVAEDLPGEASTLPRRLRARLAARRELAQRLFFRR